MIKSYSRPETEVVHLHPSSTYLQIKSDDIGTGEGGAEGSDVDIQEG